MPDLVLYEFPIPRIVIGFLFDQSYTFGPVKRNTWIRMWCIIALGIATVYKKLGHIILGVVMQ